VRHSGGDEVLVGDGGDKTWVKENKALTMVWTCPVIPDFSHIRGSRNIQQYSPFKFVVDFLWYHHLEWA
jgi:hypothetical protein